MSNTIFRLMKGLATGFGILAVCVSLVASSITVLPGQESTRDIFAATTFAVGLLLFFFAWWLRSRFIGSHLNVPRGAGQVKGTHNTSEDGNV